MTTRLPKTIIGVMFGLFVSGVFWNIGCQPKLPAVRPTQKPISTQHMRFEQQQGRYRIGIEVESPPLHPGPETFLVKMYNLENEEPLTDWDMQTQVIRQADPLAEELPSIEGANIVHAPTKVRRLSEPGFYRVETTFPQGGTWYVVVQPEDNPKQKASNLFYFKVDVQDSEG